jgi:hypothetical protein
MKGHKAHHHHPKAEHGHSGRAYKKGGAVHEEIYAGKGSHVAHDAEEKEDAFKKGGRAKKKHVGKAEGAAAHRSAARKPRKSGGSVLSSAAHGTPRPGFKG